MCCEEAHAAHGKARYQPGFFAANEAVRPPSIVESLYVELAIVLVVTEYFT